MRIGILAIQGDIGEHERALREAGAEPVRMRVQADIDSIDGLVLPGGESTTIGMLAGECGLTEAIRGFIASGRPAWGTCGGLILMADRAGTVQPLIGGLDVRVERNAFGRQVDSFEADLPIAHLDGGPFRAVFIRAPAVTEVGPGVDVLARLEDGTVVAVQQGRLLGTSFHPELADDLRLHRYFLSLGNKPCRPSPSAD